MLTVTSSVDRSAFHLRLVEMLKGKLDIPCEDDFKDAELLRIVAASVDTVETETHRTLLNRTYRLDTWGFHTIHLPKPPFVELTGTLVRYYDLDDAVQTLSPDAYSVTPDEPAFLWFRCEDLYPITLSDERPYPVEVTYTAGYGTAHTDLPSSLLEGILLLAYHRFRNPETCNAGMPAACVHYLNPFYFRDHKAMAEVTA